MLMDSNSLPTNRELDITAHRASLEDAKVEYDRIFSNRRQDFGASLLSLHNNESERLEIAEREKAFIIGFGNAILPKAKLDAIGMYFDVDDVFTAHLIRSYSVRTQINRNGKNLSDEDYYLGACNYYFPIGFHRGANGFGELLAIRPSYDFTANNTSTDATLLRIISTNDALELIEATQDKLFNMPFTETDVLEMRPAGSDKYRMSAYSQVPQLFDKFCLKWPIRQLTTGRLLTKGLPHKLIDEPIVCDFREIQLSSYNIEKKMTELAVAFGKTDELKSLYDMRLDKN